MDRFDARKAIVAEFEAMSLLEKIDDHALKVRAVTAPAPSSNPG
ncbi:hypothetical protein [Stutzerimonas xanthomarina]